MKITYISLVNLGCNLFGSHFWPWSCFGKYALIFFVDFAYNREYCRTSADENFLLLFHLNHYIEYYMNAVANIHIFYYFKLEKINMSTSNLSLLIYILLAGISLLKSVNTCSVGQYPVGTFDPTCKPCRVGCYYPKTGTTNYEWCPAGTYQPNKSATLSTDCLACPLGTYTSGQRYG